MLQSIGTSEPTGTSGGEGAASRSERELITAVKETVGVTVGCDVVETCTFQSTPHRLEEMMSPGR